MIIPRPGRTRGVLERRKWLQVFLSFRNVDKSDSSKSLSEECKYKPKPVINSRDLLTGKSTHSCRGMIPSQDSTAYNTTTRRKIEQQNQHLVREVYKSDPLWWWSRSKIFQVPEVPRLQIKIIKINYGDFIHVVDKSTPLGGYLVPKYCKYWGFCGINEAWTRIPPPRLYFCC